MSEHNHTIPNGGRNGPDESMALDVLVGRIVDGEASDVDRRRFEDMASADALLWRRLALRQQDMHILAARIEPALNAAERIELPVHDAADGMPLVAAIPQRAGRDSLRSTPRMSWWAAAVGWAAVIVLATTWGISHQRDINRPVPPTVGHAADARLPVVHTPEEHLREYLSAPFVLGEMSPMLLNKEQLRDGRYAVSYLRRIVEVSYYDSLEDIPAVDDEGNLASSPHKLPSSTRPAPCQLQD